MDPSGPLSVTYPGYWLQKTGATWSAACATAGSAEVMADWGDNLTKGATLMSGKPIRVEVGLRMSTGMTGFVVVKLDDQIDRLATYGTKADVLSGGSLGTRVWDHGAWLKIQRMSDGGYVDVHNGRMTAEINSMGAVVYGFNWGIKGKWNVPALGEYKLTFTVSELTTIEGVTDAGSANPPLFTTHATSLTVRIASDTGGGGGHGGGGH